MNSKIALKYILIYLVLNTSGIIIASRFWWTDGLRLSYLNKEMAALLFSVASCWAGIVYVSILISQKIRLRQDYLKFIGPIDIQNIEILSKKVDKVTRTKLKATVPYIAFPLLIITITIFVITMKKIEISQLENYGKIETVTVKSITYDIKKNPYAYFEYNNGNNVNLPENKLKEGDKTKIIYSTKNPNIVEYYQSSKRR